MKMKYAKKLNMKYDVEMMSIMILSITKLLSVNLLVQ